MKKSSESTSAALFLLLAIAATTGVMIAPKHPDWWHFAAAISTAVITLGVLFFQKYSEPKPVNWLTIDVIFANTFSLVHFGYFPYWLTGMFDQETPLWRINRAHVDHTVTESVWMYVACLNIFLFGFHMVKTKRYVSLFRQFGVPHHKKKVLSGYARTLICLGVAGFAAYVAIVGPAVVFGNYSGTNNKGFLPNIVFQLGQVFIASGIAVAAACGVTNRQVLGLQREKKRLLGLGLFNLAMIGVVVFAIGLHGDRSTMMWIILSVVIARSEYVKPISLKSLTTFSFVIVFLLGLIVLVRSVGTKDYNKSLMETVNHTMLNFGTSSVCGMVAVDYVQQNDLGYGNYQKLAIVGAVPFGRKLVGMVQSEENDSATLLTVLINGKGKQAGAGTSIFADFYFDFGFWGTLFVFWIMGACCKWMQNRSRASNSLLWQVAYLSLCVYMAIVSRYSLLGGIIRLVIYAAIFSWVVARFLGIATKFRIRSNHDSNSNFGGPRSVAHNGGHFAK